jgi:hypothetical protein
MAQAAPRPGQVDELERRRAADRERARRHRERKKHAAPGAPPVSPRRPPSSFSDFVQSAATSSAFPVHATTPLESIGSTPEAYTAIPPELGDVAAPPPDPAADAARAQGAAKVAFIVSQVFAYALGDAVEHFDLVGKIRERFPALPADRVSAVLGSAAMTVYQSTERCCLKYGVGIAVPYEDELVTLGALAGSAAYLGAKFTGQLERGKGTERAADDDEDLDDAPVRRRGPIDVVGDVIDNPHGTLRMEAR